MVQKENIIFKKRVCFFLRVTVSDSSQLGSYTCILKGEKEVSAVFHLEGNLINLYLFKIFVSVDHCKAV